MRTVVNRIQSFFAAGCSLLLCTVTVFAQQSGKVNYRSTTFVKIAPEKEAAMQDFVRDQWDETDSGRDKLRSVRSSASFRISYSGIPAADYNYLQAINYDAAPPALLNPAARDQMYRKATGMSYQEYEQKLMSFGAPVGTVCPAWSQLTAPGSQMTEGNYVRTIRWKITSQRGADFGNYIQKMMQPLERRRHEGGTISRLECHPNNVPGRRRCVLRRYNELHVQGSCGRAARRSSRVRMEGR